LSPESSEPDPEARRYQEALLRFLESGDAARLTSSVPADAAVEGFHEEHLRRSRPTPLELAHTQAMERSKEEHRQKLELLQKQQEWRNGWITTGLLGAFVLICAGVLAFNPNVEMQRLAFGGLAAGITGWLTYATGRAHGKS
jgi:hypothetical protein